jgi:phage tail sheath protein FI
MAELTFRSAGVSTREIDLSQPSVTGPTGVPAGIIGTALEGPAFVPLTVATFADFQTVFGPSDGEKFGPLAVNQWLSNARACTYIRVLGAGNGRKRNDSTGVVTNGGFFVGDQQVQSNGNLGDNPYANTGVGSVKGRVHFLGCFMSESAGSTIFSSAGIQNDSAAKAIMRGILLAPSGVVLTLSGNGAQGGANTPNSSQTATDGSSLIGRTGEISGSLDLSTQQFVMLLNGHKSTAAYPNVITASFDMTSPNYFAKVMNEDPLKAEQAGHLLYARYDIYPDLAAVTGSGIVTAGTYSLGSGEAKEDIALLLTSSAGRGSVVTNVPVYESFEDRFAYAESPYIISQNYGASPKDLFKVVMLSAGDTPNNKYKFSIENINRVTVGSDQYGSFDLVVRDFNDADDEKVVLEAFRGLSLNPESDRYITRVIGDQNVFFDFDSALDSQKIIVDGEYPVRSRYIRIKASTDLKNGNVPEDALPVGFRGPRHTVTSGSLLAGGVNAVYGVADAARGLREPPVPYRETVALSTGLKKRDDARLYWGAQTTRKTSITEPNKAGLLDESFDSYVKYLPNFRLDTTNFSVGDNAGTADVLGSILDSDRFNNNIFTLERIKVRTGSDGIADPEQWLSASYVRQGGISDDATAKTRAFRLSDLDTVANRRYAKFTFFAQGGFNGTNIFNADKSNLTNNAARREMTDANQGETSGPTVAAYRKAVDVMGSKSDVEIQLLAIPGIRHSSVTDYAISAIENRFDALYVMDIEEQDKFNAVITSSVQQPNVTYTVNTFKGRALDTSFAAAYFPDVVVQDPTTLTNVSAPPSVAVMGAMSLNDAVGHPWFAPAGFTRGALDAVEFVSTRLNRDNLDDLYEADINPITAFPGTGVTVWGQKTLLANQSALDRINVRRLLIDIRRQVRNVANTLLFEPNREETLEKFTALVNPILQRVQDLSGVERYKVIIDTTTTTQADVENNTIRGKIFLQPTRTAEFVALDFVVTNAGAEI